MALLFASVIFFVVPLQAQRFDYLIPSLTDVKQEDIKAFIDVVCDSMDLRKIQKPVVAATMNVPVDMYDPLPRPRGVVGCICRAWTSVVFLLVTGIAKPLRSVKNRRTSRFLYAYTLEIISI